MCLFLLQFAFGLILAFGYLYNTIIANGTVNLRIQVLLSFNMAPFTALLLITNNLKGIHIMNISRLIITGLLASTLAGCVIVAGDHDEFDREFSSSDWEDVESANRAAISKLIIGDDYNATLTRLGQASFSEAFQMGDATYQILYYRTHRKHSDGDTTKDETTPLVFKDQKLVGWGDEALSRVR